MPLIVDTTSRERVALAAGSYGTSKQAGLKILSYLDNPKTDKNGALEHTFLVAATQASKESKEAFKAFNATNPLEEPEFEGTAFLRLKFHPVWLSPEAIALGFTEASRPMKVADGGKKVPDMEAAPRIDYVAAALALPETDPDHVSEETIAKAKAWFMQKATDKVVGANTPAEQMEAAVDLQYHNELLQVSINVGTFFRLQDWKYGAKQSDKRSWSLEPKELVNTEFSGKVEHRGYGTEGKVSVEVSGVFDRK